MIIIIICIIILLPYSCATLVFAYLIPNMNKDSHRIDLWLRKHQEKSDTANIQLAIHTLRNSNYVAVFIGGAVFQMAVNVSHLYPSSSNDIIEKIRIMTISITLFLSFLCWAFSLRSSFHLGYMIGIDKYHDISARDPEEQSTGYVLGEIPYTSYQSDLNIPNLPHTPSQTYIPNLPTIPYTSYQSDLSLPNLPNTTPNNTPYTYSYSDKLTNTITTFDNISIYHPDDTAFQSTQTLLCKEQESERAVYERNLLHSIHICIK